MVGLYEEKKIKARKEYIRAAVSTYEHLIGSYDSKMIKYAIKWRKDIYNFKLFWKKRLSTTKST